MRSFAVVAAAGLLTILMIPAMAQVPSGSTGLGDARAQNQPTSRGMPGAHHHAYGRPHWAGYGRHYQRHHRPHHHGYWH
jgi:hypothetical protein